MTISKLEEAFRLKHRELKREEQARIDRIKQKAVELAQEFYPHDSRAKSIAQTKLEECVMWAVKGITE